MLHQAESAPAAATADLAVFGGTPGGIIAAVAAARRGADVVLLEPTGHVGGLSTSGLNTSEKEHMLEVSFSGIQREFYERIGRYYGHDVPQYRWESHRAEAIFREMLEEAAVAVRFGARLAEGPAAVVMAGGHLRSIALDDGARVAARIWIDASYEGDLAAAAGVRMSWGREPRHAFGERLAGQRFVEAGDEVEHYAGTVTSDELIPVSPYDAHGVLLPFFTPAASSRWPAGWPTRRRRRSFLKTSSTFIPFPAGVTCGRETGWRPCRARSGS